MRRVRAAVIPAKLKYLQSKYGGASWDPASTRAAHKDAVDFGVVEAEFQIAGSAFALPAFGMTKEEMPSPFISGSQPCARGPSRLGSELP